MKTISASRHHVLTLAELEGAGLSARAVRHRVAGGRLIRMYRGIFCVGGPTTHAWWLGAVLACGEEAALSHRSAAALWGLVSAGATKTDVAVAGRAGRRRTGIAVHRGEKLDAGDVTIREGIPCTSLARTLLDYAATTTPRRLELALSQADVLRVLDTREIHAVLDRNPRRCGSRQLRATLAAYTEPAITRSELEEQLFAALDRAGLARPRVNAFVALDANTGYHPDLFWPDAKLVLEADSQRFHASLSRRRHDARRDRRLKLAGYETFRWAGEDPAELVEHVIAYLAATTPAGAGHAPVAGCRMGR